jgi:hypothetical protein
MATVALSGIITPSNVVTATSTATLTNKTLTAPTIASANLTTALTIAGDAGSSGNVLTSGGSGAAPTWSTPSAGAMTLISTTVASSSATVDFTGLSSTYKDYVVIVNNAVPATDNAALVFRTSTNNGSTYNSGGSDYFSTGTNFGSSAWNYLSVVDDRAYLNASGQDNTANLGGTSFTMTIVNPASTSNRTVWYLTGYEKGNSEDGAFTRGGSRISVSGGINAIRFFYGTGNIASGTFKLYGIS